VLANLNDVEVAGPTSVQLPHSVLESDSSTEAVATLRPTGPIHQAMPLTKSLDEAAVMGSEIDYSVKTVLARPFLLTSLDWKAATASEKGIGSFEVFTIPCYEHKTTTTPAVTYAYMPLSAHLIRGFKYFRGDFKFTFKIPRTKYHSGTLAVSYDPGQVSVLRAGTRTNYVKLLNLTSENDDDFSLTIPFNNWYPYMSGEPMGTITVSVFNQLVAPDTVSQQIPVLVYQSYENVTLQYPIPWNPLAPRPVQVSTTTTDEKENLKLTWDDKDLESDTFVENVEPINAQPLVGKDMFQKNNWDNFLETLKIPIPMGERQAVTTLKCLIRDTAIYHYYGGILFQSSTYAAGDSIFRIVDLIPFTPNTYAIQFRDQHHSYYSGRFRPYIDYVAPFMSNQKFVETETTIPENTVKITPAFLNSKISPYDVCVSWDKVHFYGRRAVRPIMY
jgi:hypothetical protein